METLKREHRITKPPEIEEMDGNIVDFARKGTMEADGTRYSAFVLPIVDFNLQMLGAVKEGYLVINGLTRKAYLLQRKGYLDPSYIQEKFGGTITDAENFVTLLGEMLPERQVWNK